MLQDIIPSQVSEIIASLEESEAFHFGPFLVRWTENKGYEVTWEEEGTITLSTKTCKTSQEALELAKAAIQKKIESLIKFQEEIK